MKKLLVACIGVFAIAARVRAQAPVFGPEFLANVTTTNDFFHRAGVASLGPAGDFVVTWSYYSYSSLYENNVMGRRFSKTGAPLGGEFQINASTALNEDQAVARTASNASGDFVVTWTNGDPTGPPSQNWDVGARRFDSSGTPVSGDIVVNQYTTGRQTDSSVAIDSTGAFVIVWSSYSNLGSPLPGQDGSDSGIFGRRFDSSGDPLGDEFLINQYTTGDQMAPRIAMRPDGNFLVVWNDDHNSAIMNEALRCRWRPLGGEVQVSTTGTLGVESPDVALDGDGKAIVVWNVIPGVDSINGQRLDASGNKLGPEFNVHTGTTGLRRSPAVAVGPDGGFSVTWMSNGQDGDSQAVVAQRFDSTGRRIGGELLVNTFTTGVQSFSRDRRAAERAVRRGVEQPRPERHRGAHLGFPPVRSHARRRPARRRARRAERLVQPERRPRSLRAGGGGARIRQPLGRSTHTVRNSVEFPGSRGSGLHRRRFDRRLRHDRRGRQRRLLPGHGRLLPRRRHRSAARAALGCDVR